MRIRAGLSSATGRGAIAALALGLALAGQIGAAAKGPATTLDRTIVPAGKHSLKYGPGEGRWERGLEWETGGPETGTPLGGFKHVSDIHVIDEESPGRLEFFDQCGPGYTDSHRVQDALTTQVGDAMLQALGDLDVGPATGVPLDFTISTGDNIDSNQFNELRWFIDLLDGETVDPNSGAETYDGYTKAEFKGSLSDTDLELANQPFDAVGSDVPWYAVLGNHDGLIRGVVAPTPEFNGLVTGDRKPFIPIKGYDDCPSEETGGATGAALRAFFSPQTRTVPADPDRHFMSRDEIVAEYFDTTGEPVGHGLENAPDDPVSATRASYYAFDVAPQILGLSLDTINYEGGADGTVSEQQFRWLEQQLQANSSSYYSESGALAPNPAGTDKLIVLFSHHTSKTMDNPGTNADYAPYHCFEPEEGCEAEGLGSLLSRFPNVIAWVNGHEHRNRISPHFDPSGLEAARAYWEINTAAHVDWPQQSRLVEFAWLPGSEFEEDIVVIYVTIVDHSAAPKPSYDTQSPVHYLASRSRLEAYIDACVRKGQADCKALGKPQHRNVKLTQKAPFALGP